MTRWWCGKNVRNIQDKDKDGERLLKKEEIREKGEGKSKGMKRDKCMGIRWKGKWTGRRGRERGRKQQGKRERREGESSRKQDGKNVM